MAMQHNEPGRRPVTAVMTQIERVPARLCYATAGGLAASAGLSMLTGNRRLSAFAAACAAAVTACAVYNRSRGAQHEQGVAPDPAPRAEDTDQPLDYVDEMSADSFPASDPPAGPASLGPPTWPAGTEPR